MNNMNDIKEDKDGNVSFEGDEYFTIRAMRIFRKKEDEAFKQGERQVIRNLVNSVEVLAKNLIDKQ